jgi:hypothetical protein
MPRLTLLPTRDSENSHPTERVDFDVQENGAFVEVTVGTRALRFDGPDMLDVLETLKRRRSALGAL